MKNRLPGLSNSVTTQNSAWFWLATLLLTIVFFKNAWVCEDAYINFRSLDQLFAGNGPNWNAHIRAQVYTSALWYWLSAVLALGYRDYFIDSIALSFFCGVITVYYLRRIANATFYFFLIAFITVTCRSLSDYTSSGLENPLAFSLITAFVFYLYKLTASAQRENYQALFTKLCLLMGLTPLVRHDLAVLLLIPYCYAYFFIKKTANSGINKTQLALLVCPLIFFTFFSIVYYGFPFPNTAYAKLYTSVDRFDLIKRGLSYFQAHLLWDPVVIFILVTAITAGLYARQRATNALSLGLAAYLLYLIYIGSDYMLGRMLSVPVLLGLIIIARLNAEQKNLLKRNYLLWLLALLSIFFLLKDPYNNPLLSSTSWGFQKGNLPMPVMDNFDVRFGEYPHNSLWAYLKGPQKNSITTHNWCEKGLEAQGRDVVVRGPVGMYGFCAGRDVIIIDQWGITDPFLARLPSKVTKWRPGHFTRIIPEGYKESLASNQNLIVDPGLRDYYGHIHQITDMRKPTFNLERLLTILKMNLGMYKYQLATEVDHNELH